jgi:hypothetical protein
VTERAFWASVYAQAYTEAVLLPAELRHERAKEAADRAVEALPAPRRRRATASAQAARGAESSAASARLACIALERDVARAERDEAREELREALDEARGKRETK